MLPPIRMYRHDSIMTNRPYGMDLDADGWMWEGCGRNRHNAHRLGSGEIRDLEIPEMDDGVVYQVFVWQDRLIMTLGESSHYLVYDPTTGRAQKMEIPGTRPIVWYGVKTGDDRVLLYDRAVSAVLALDAPDARPRAVPCPYVGQLASGWWSVGDGYVYSPLYEPARLIRFDPVRARFIDEIHAPFPEASLAGVYEHEGVLYLWDT
ncbi:MAG: hypothetical protein FJY97_08535 [candidate division Zixibacteria bacterium]|nr:hypothetical protein [candidate division Zixibacteria bacterium]